MRFKIEAPKMRIEIHELDVGYVVEYGMYSYSVPSLLEVVQYILILQRDEEKREQLSAQIADVFERVLQGGSSKNEN